MARFCRALEAVSVEGRRFQVQGEFEVGGYTVKLVDDYGHHPKKSKQPLKQRVPAIHDRRLAGCYCFKLHRFSCTRDCFDDFVDVFSQVDATVDGLSCEKNRLLGRYELWHGVLSTRSG